jgi:hypothetical protein
MRQTTVQCGSCGFFTADKKELDGRWSGVCPVAKKRVATDSRACRNKIDLRASSLTRSERWRIIAGDR